MTTPVLHEDWTPDEMRALDRFMRANREMRDALAGMKLALPDVPAQLKFETDLIAMRDHYWPFYQEMTLQNLKKQAG